MIREGIETALFLIAATTGYQGGRTIPMRMVFQVTGVLIIVFAPGLLAKAMMFLQGQYAGDLGSVEMAAYDLTGVRWLTSESQVGRFLAGISGWDPRPRSSRCSCGWPR